MQPATAAPGRLVFPGPFEAKVEDAGTARRRSIAVASAGQVGQRVLGRPGRLVVRAAGTDGAGPRLLAEAGCSMSATSATARTVETPPCSSGACVCPAGAQANWTCRWRCSHCWTADANHRASLPCRKAGGKASARTMRSRVRSLQQSSCATVALVRRGSAFVMMLLTAEWLEQRVARGFMPMPRTATGA